MRALIIITNYKGTYIKRITSTQIIKRSMRTSRQVVANAVDRATKYPGLDKRSMSYYKIHNTKPETSSHEQAKENPILTTRINKPFQHSGIVEDCCKDPDCNIKKCSKLCGPLEQSAHIGHATHSSKFGVYGSLADLENKNIPQYIKMYSEPQENTTGDNHLNTQRTTNLQGNTELKDNIHVNKSTKKMQKATIGSDNFDENIN